MCQNQIYKRRIVVHFPVGGPVKQQPGLLVSVDVTGKEKVAPWSFAGASPGAPTL